MSTHSALTLPSKPSRYTLTTLTTPTPGPNEVLIAPQALALNPIDYYARVSAFFVAKFPAVVGSDISGTVLAAGSAIPSSSPLAKSGTRVVAFANSYYSQGDTRYGAFQEKVLVPSENVAPIPESLSFEHAAVMPMAVATVWAGIYTIGLPRSGMPAAAGAKGMLVWGASSSVGSAAVQVFRDAGFTVYGVASAKHHAMVKKLGAARAFDHKDADVVGQIVAAAKDDGIAINVAYDSAAQIKHSMEVVRQAKTSGTKGRVMSAARLPEDKPEMADVEVKFVSAPAEEGARNEHFSFVFNTWLAEKLKSGQFVASPEVKSMEGGLDGVNEALDELQKGVSGLKLVVPLK